MLKNSTLPLFSEKQRALARGKLHPNRRALALDLFSGAPIKPFRQPLNTRATLILKNN
jgi:hypothetical protein